MKKKKIILLLFAFSIFAAAIGYVLTNSVQFHLCGPDFYVCRSILNKIGDPLLYGMGATALIFLILFFVPGAFSRWWKFAIWYIPLAIFVFATIPEPHGWINIYPTPDSVYRWVTGIYIGISFALVALSTKRAK